MTDNTRNTLSVIDVSRIRDMVNAAVDAVLERMRQEHVIQRLERGEYNMPKFGNIDMVFGVRIKWGTDVEGWLDECEQVFSANNVSDERKVSIISHYLLYSVSVWHEHFLRVMGENVDWISYKKAILRRFGNSRDDASRTVSGSKRVVDSSLPGTHKMFDEIPIRNNLEQEGVKEAREVDDENMGLMGLNSFDHTSCVLMEDVQKSNDMVEYDNVLLSCEGSVESNEFVDNDSSEVIDNGIDMEVLDEVGNDEVQVEGNQLKDSKEDDENKKCSLISNDVVEGGKGSKDCNDWFANQIAKTKDKLKMDSGYVMCRTREILGGLWKPMVKMRRNGSIMVEMVKGSLEVENEANDDEQVSEDIKTIDVLRSGGFEIDKSGMEKWTRHEVNKMERQVGVSDLRKYEDGLIRVNDSLLFGLHFNNGEFILIDEHEFDPGGKLYNQELEAKGKSQLVAAMISYVLGKDSETENGVSGGGLESTKSRIEKVKDSVKMIRGDIEDCILKSQDKKVKNDVKGNRKRGCLSNLIFGNDDMNSSSHLNRNSDCMGMGVNEFVGRANGSEGNLVLRSNSRFFADEYERNIFEVKDKRGIGSGACKFAISIPNYIDQGGLLCVEMYKLVLGWNLEPGKKVQMLMGHKMQVTGEHQILFKKERQWFCDMNKFLANSSRTSQLVVTSHAVAKKSVEAVMKWHVLVENLLLQQEECDNEFIEESDVEFMVKGMNCIVTSLSTIPLEKVTQLAMAKESVGKALEKFWSSDKKMVFAAQSIGREACIKVLFLEVASVYEYVVRHEVRKGIKGSVLGVGVWKWPRREITCQAKSERDNSKWTYDIWRWPKKIKEETRFERRLDV